MSYKVCSYTLSSRLNFRIGWRLAAPLIFALSFSLGIRESRAGADSKFAAPPAQDQNLIAAQKSFAEGMALSKQGTGESLRLAVKKYEEALQLWRTAGNRFGEASTLNEIAAIYNALGEYQKSLESFNQSLPLWRAIGNRFLEASTLNNIGVVYNTLGDNQKALEYLDRALPLQRANGNRSGEAATLNAIGTVYKSRGELRKALDFFTQAAALIRALGDRGREAVLLTNIGAVYNSLGENQKALDFYNQALPLQRGVGDRDGEATTLGNIGAVYNSLGEGWKALDLFNQALPLHRVIGDRSGEARTLNNIGYIYKSLGENQKALDLYNQALPLYRDIGDRGGEANTLNNVSDIYAASGENQKALDLLNQSLPLYRAVEDRIGEARALYRFGFISVLKEEWRKGLDFFTQALPIFREIGSRDGEVITLGAMADAHRALGHFAESRSHIESALKIIESQRVKVVSKELRASYFATVESYYKSYIELLMRLHGLEPKSGHMAAALEASERARARSLLESLAEARADIRRGADPKLLERERSLQQSLNARAEETLKLSARKADKARLAMSRREIDALTIELQEVQTRIRQTSPRYGELTQPQPLTLAEIQRQALDADTLLLEYSLGKERSFLWAVTPTTIDSYELPKREDVEAAARRVYELLSKTPGLRSQPSSKSGASSPVTDGSSKPPVLRRQPARPGDSGLKGAGEKYSEVAAALSRILLGPVAKELGKKRLLIVADGALHYIPFGALPDPNSLKEGEGSWQPLVVEHEIVNSPSASTIAAMRRELEGRKPAPKTLAVLADPVFSKDDERIKSGARGAAQAPAQPNPLNQSIVRKLGQDEGEASAPDDLIVKRLPFTRREAEQITALAPAGAALKALDFAASRATATSDRLSQYRYIHISTHGLSDSERPELSAIVLSLFDEQGKPQDGFLRAHEIYNLELPAELVTLSACKTGLGKLIRGEGLVSLTRGFMYAGAARVVVSLWSVRDWATAELMTKFYRRMLVNGERPAAALRAAQVEMWRDMRWEEPYYWAAFTMQGEWR